MREVVTAPMWAASMPNVSVVPYLTNRDAVVLEIGQNALLTNVPNDVAIALMWELLYHFLPDAVVTVETEGPHARP